MLSMIALSTKYRTLTNPATAETSPNTAIALLDQRVPGNDQTTYWSCTTADNVARRGYTLHDPVRVYIRCRTKEG